MKLKAMVIGEFSRLAKYNLFTASIVVAFIWIGLGLFLEADQMLAFLPFVFFMEASAMTALLVGAEMFYEKKEHTISSMLISPITQWDYILSKIFTHLINIMVIFLLISIGLYFVNDMVFNYGWLLVSTLIVTAFYVGVGLILSYISKDFTTLLINYMFIIILIMLPTLLVLLGVIDPAYADVVKYMPSEVTIRLLSTSIDTTVDLTQFLIDAAYMVGFGIVMFWFVVIPGFKKFATEYLGV
jgi:fluoroquinolone transport system permease protein